MSILEMRLRRMCDALIRLYPRRFQELCGKEMRALAERRLAETRARGRGRVARGLGLCAALVWHAALAHFDQLRSSAQRSVQSIVRADGRAFGDGAPC